MAARECAGLVVVRVAVCRWASGLENLRVVAGGTRLRGVVGALAAVLVSPVLLAGALAGNHSPTASLHAQLGRAAVPKVGDAPGSPAGPGAARRRDLQWDVVAVHEAYVIEIRVATDCELRQGGRRRPAGAIAIEPASAVGSGAGAGARCVEVAARAAPEAARPARRGVHRGGLSCGESEATTSEGSTVVTREDARPDCLRAAVDYREHRSANSNAPCKISNKTNSSATFLTTTPPAATAAVGSFLTE